MELYVEKELKDKFEPLKELLDKQKVEISSLSDRIDTLDGHIRRVDKHYNGVSKAMLVKQGIILKEINELSILKEYKRMSEKSKLAIRRLKMRNTSSMSPSNRRSEGSPCSVRELDSTTKFMTKLAPMAAERKLRKSSPQHKEMQEEQ